MQVAALAPYPTSIDPRIQIMRSIEWCPYPLKCIVTKTPITGKWLGTPCMCSNCVLFRTGSA